MLNGNELQMQLNSNVKRVFNLCVKIKVHFASIEMYITLHSHKSVLNDSADNAYIVHRHNSSSLNEETNKETIKSHQLLKM